jgi:hypothetical protein
LSGIEILNYPTQRKAWTALMRGDIDMLYDVSREAADFVQAETTVKTYSFPRPYYIPLVFNVTRPILKQVEVGRRSTKLSTRTLVRDGMKGRRPPADSPILRSTGPTRLHRTVRIQSRRREAAWMQRAGRA